MCVTAADATADPDIGEAATAMLAKYGPSEGSGGEGVVLAALLARSRYARESAASTRFGTYSDALPWGDGRDESAAEVDSLQGHPLMADPETSPLGVARAKLARSAARDVATVLASCGMDLSEERCLRALTLIASRSFDLTAGLPKPAPGGTHDGERGEQERPAPDPPTTAPPTVGPSHRTYPWTAVMIPLLDFTNHPSVSGMGGAGEAGMRFREGFFSSAAFKARRYPQGGTLKLRGQWQDANDANDAEGACADGAWPPAAAAVRLESLTVAAPPGLPLRAGEELLNWYGDAGWGESTAEARAAGERRFVASYGFSPWQ